MRITIGRFFAVAVGYGLAVASLSGCGNSAQSMKSEPISLLMPQTDGPLILHVRADAFDNGQDIPDKYSAYGKNISPRLSWSGTPVTAKSLIVMVEDPDSRHPTPFVHWLIYNIPPDQTTLPPGISPVQRPPEVPGAGQGMNSSGSIGYYGPHPPKGDPAHHYHFEVFALDRVLTPPPDATRDMLIQQMAGHVIAKGELIGTFRER